MRWFVFASLAVGAVFYARWVYRRVDLPVPGTHFLWPLRAAALVLVLLLLFDPMIPWGGAGSSSRWVLLDASASMAAAVDGTTPWAEASRRAETLRADGWRVVAFGGATTLVEGELEAAPSEAATRLAPALALAAEGGAREVRVLSDLRLEDEVAVRSALELLGSNVVFERFGGDVSNAGILALEVLDRNTADTEGLAVVEVHGGIEGETLTFEVYEEDRLIAEATTVAPGPGLRRSVEVDLPPAAGSGLLRYEVALSTDTRDDFGLDDRAVGYGRVALADEGGVVLVSFAADWEPRYLLPVLGRTSGLSASGYLRAGTDRFVSMGRALDRGPTVDSAAVRRAVEDAALVVMHGVHGELDAWARSLLSLGPRRVVFVADAAGAALVGVPVAGPRPGEWYASPDLPPSPIAAELAGAFGEGLPPLRRLWVPTDPDGLFRPFLVQLAGAGASEGPLVLRVRDDGRDAVALASGFWRWAARERSRGAYEALWAGVAGWLLRDRTVTGAEPQPTRWIFPRGASVDWRVPANRTGYGVRVTGAVEEALDTVFATDGIVPTGPLPPGSYVYTVVDQSGDSVGAGRFDVAETTADMLPSPVDAERLRVTRTDTNAFGQGGRPLRTLPWPYLMIIGLLCAEWFGRRRSGLR